jgi:hypothetical protein
MHTNTHTHGGYARQAVQRMSPFSLHAVHLSEPKRDDMDFLLPEHQLHSTKPLSPQCPHMPSLLTSERW